MQNEDKEAHKELLSILSEIRVHIHSYQPTESPIKWIKENFDKKKKEFIDFWFEKKTIRISRTNILHRRSGY